MIGFTAGVRICCMRHRRPPSTRLLQPHVAFQPISTLSKQSQHYRDIRTWWKQASRQGKAAVYAVSGLSTATAGFLFVKPRGSQFAEDSRDRKALGQVPFSKLVSGWIAFTFCSSPTWVDLSEPLYNIASSIPILSSITHVFVMRTFFTQFLGGETIEDCVPKIQALRRNQTGTLLGYNVEAELDGSSKDPQLILDQTQHVLSSIDAQGQLAKQFWPSTHHTGGDNRCWVRIKMTGLLLHPIALHHGSTAILESRKIRGLDKDVPYPGLVHDGDWDAALRGKGVTEEDREQLLSLRATMEAITSKARDNNVRIVIDAEQSWYQPAIDSLTDELMQKYNTLDGPATCIASFQAYLRRHPQFLDHQIMRAEEKGYKLLFKQVRGAYMITEADQWKKDCREGQGPVWPTKPETDASYNYGLRKTLSVVSDQIKASGASRISAMFATHNSDSIDLGIALLEKNGLTRGRNRDGKLVITPEAAGSIAFGQIYGMKDDLTNRITGSVTAEGGFPLVVKSMSYGDLKECLPFLARRATENKAVLEGRGGALAERVRLGREIGRRLWPWSSVELDKYFYI